MNEVKTTTVEMDVRELNAMKAEEEVMKQTMSALTDQLEEAEDELMTTKAELRQVMKDLRDTKILLHKAIELQQEAEDTTTRCERIMMGYLNRWLTNENRARAAQMLRFYHPRQRVMMMDALLTYLMFGKKLRLEREVEKTHFKIMCDLIDEDSITLPAHSLMVKMMKRHGLL